MVKTFFVNYRFFRQRKGHRFQCDRPTLGKQQEKLNLSKSGELILRCAKVEEFAACPLDLINSL